MSTGTRSVITTNSRVRTRSRYSRLATMRIFLSMAGHPLLDAARAHAVDEDLVQRRLDELEPFDRGAGVDQPAQQHLRIGLRRQLELEEPIVIAELAHQPRIAQHVTNAVLRRAPSGAAQAQRHGATAVRLLDSGY